ncbi:MAG: YgaP family membrane protein [Desulfotomaculales bacterium]
MKENVGRTDRLLRMAGGATLMALRFFGVTRGFWGTLLATVGLIELFSGYIRYCPVLDALGISTVEEKG